MQTLWALRIALLIVFGVPWGARVSSQDSCDRNTGLRVGAGQSCCGNQPFNPEIATCCTVGRGSKQKVRVTQGRKQAVSSCCGLMAYDRFNETCCHSEFVASSKSHGLCGTETYDKPCQLCCGELHNKTLVTKKSIDHLCCGQEQYDPKTQQCCGGKEIKSICSQCDVNNSAPPCAPFCQPNVSHKTAPNSKCCGDKMFDNNTQLCCGSLDSKKLHEKKSSNHKCCGQEQYDSQSQCCISRDGYPTVIDGLDCPDCNSGVQHQKLDHIPHCTEPNGRRCGAQYYNPDTHDCCHRHHIGAGDSWRCVSGQRDVEPTVFNPHTHVCWDGCLSERTLVMNQLNGCRGGHCCGTESYQPHDEICCDGQRHRKGTNIACCGRQAYNIEDPLKKCCAKTLHNLTKIEAAHVRCCGSSLQNQQNQVCCSGEDKEMLHATKRGFSCCGHHYINGSKQRCCGGRPAPPSGQNQRENNKDWRLLSVNSLNKTDLCSKMYIGTLESVSPHGILFGSVMKIHGRNASVSLHSHHILDTPDDCILPQLTPRKQYLFDERYVYVDFNHGDIHQSLFFIFSKCLI